MIVLKPPFPRLAPDRHGLPGEWEKTGLMTGVVCALLAAHTVVEPAAQALFLAEWGAQRLPWLYLLSMLPGAAMAGLYARVSRSQRIERMLVLSLVFFASNLAVFRLALYGGWVGAKVVLYLWTNVFGVLVTSQFWLLANHLFDAREARRRFALIALGAIAGGVLGGGLAARLAPSLGAEALLVVGIGLIALAVLLVLVLARRQRETLRLRHAEARKEAILARAGEEGAWPAIRRSRHLKLLIALTATTVFAATFADYLFKTVAALAYPTQDELTSFLGLFQAALSAVSFLIQLALVAAWAPLLRSAGVVGALAILPTVLGAGSLLLMASPRLLTTAAVKAADASLRYSLHRSTFELLFLPVPIDVRRRTKAVVDLFGERFARAAAGLVLLAMLSLGMNQPRLLAASLGLSAVAIAAVVSRLGKTYLAALRASVAGRAIDLERESLDALDGATIEILRRALGAESPRQVLYALEMLAAVDDPSLAPAVRPLLQRPEPEVRQQALALLARSASAADVPHLEPLVDDPDDGVRAGAIALLCEHGGAATLERFLAHPDGRVRAGAIACLPDLPSHRNLFSRERLNAALAATGPHRSFIRREVAAALARAAEPGLADLVEELLDDRDAEVVRAAIEAAGRLRDPLLVPRLLDKLARPDLRRAARGALAAHGDPVLPAIAHVLNDPRAPVAVRVALPRVLAALASPAATAMLLAHLQVSDPDLRLATLKALGHLVDGGTGRTLDPATIQRSIHDEARRHFELSTILHGQRDATSSPPRRLLLQALQEQLDRSLERIFRLLGLRYPPRDIFQIYRKIVAGPLAQKASAIELLDNLVQPDLKRVLFPILEPISLQATLDAGRRLFDLPAVAVEAGLKRLARDEDPWLRTLALHLIGAERLIVLAPVCAGATGDPDPMVREEAATALAAFGQAPEDSGAAVLSVVERVLLLQRIEVLGEVPTRNLAQVAMIAREDTYPDGTVLLAEGEPADALYIVVEGKVTLSRGGRVVQEAKRYDAFGTWSLFDDEPAVVSARTAGEVFLLRIDREDFLDLLPDHAEITRGVLKAQAKRIRSLLRRDTTPG